MPFSNRIPWQDLAVAGIYALLSLIFTWPLVTRLSTHVLGMPGDNFLFVWDMWWVQHAIFDLRVSPFLQPDIYYPYGFSLAMGDLSPAHTFLLLPLTRLIGEVATYNLVILTSTPLTGWATYRLVRRWLARADVPDSALTLASFFAGAAFAFCAYRMFRLQGHLNLVDTQWVVITLLGIDRWLETRTTRDALIAAVGFALAALCSWYYGLMLAMILPVYLLALRPDLRALATDRRTWIGVGAGAALIAVMCLPFAIPYLQLYAQDPGMFRLPADQTAFWAASPFDYVLPNLYNPLWGDAVRRVAWPLPGQPPGEFGAASIGLVVMALGLWALRHVNGPRWRALKWMAGAALVLSLGPELHFGRLPLGIPMPAALLRLLPITGSLRTWGRFSLFVELAMCLFAAAALLAALVSVRTPRIRRAVGLAVIAAVLAESTVWPLPISAVGPRPVDQWLADQPGDFAVMQYPLIVALEPDQMLYTRYHGKKITYGFGTYLPFVYTERHPALLTFPDDPALDQLAAWGVRYVIVDAASATYDEAITRVGEQPRLNYVITLGGQAVYELSSAP